MLLFAESGGQLSIGIVFWIVFLIALIFGGIRNRDAIGTWFADSLVWWVLIFLLGLGTFGFPIHL